MNQALIIPIVFVTAVSNVIHTTVNTIINIILKIIIVITAIIIITSSLIYTQMNR